jgi:DNA excision repair protein ERCC-8
MNQLFLERSTGNLSPRNFARLHTSNLVHSIQLARRLRFDGGEQEAALPHGSVDIAELSRAEAKTWAHQAGVNALSIDIEDRVLVSGGADSSIKLWNLEEIPNQGLHIFKPTAAVSR